MSEMDWNKIGDEIRKTVQEAIDSRDYNKLNQTISNTINNAVYTAERGFKNAGQAVDHAFSQAGQAMDHKAGRNRRNAYRGSGADAGRAGNAHGAPDTALNGQPPGLFAGTNGVRAGGLALSIVGGIFTGLTGLAVLILLVVAFAGGFIGRMAGLWIAISILSILTAGFGVMITIGSSMLGKSKRFRQYIQELHGKPYGDIRQIAKAVGKSQRYVLKDMKKMICSGWFREGHIDNQGTCLIVSNDAYGQYTEMMRQMEISRQQKQSEPVREETQAKKSSQNPEIQAILTEGDNYIRKIHACNEAIPGVLISQKISRMESLVDRIFDRVEQHPESVADIRKMMEYYLPTTVKLLDAYEELDNQPVQGDNIINSKSEIEKTLDTLNLAFEKLLDSLFQDTAWNVSADISVLNTMLAQEGLTKDDF